MKALERWVKVAMLRRGDAGRGECLKPSLSKLRRSLLSSRTQRQGRRRALTPLLVRADEVVEEAFSDVGYWHLADKPTASECVHFRGRSGPGQTNRDCYLITQAVISCPFQSSTPARYDKAY